MGRIQLKVFFFLPSVLVLLVLIVDFEGIGRAQLIAFIQFTLQHEAQRGGLNGSMDKATRPLVVF